MLALALAVGMGGALLWMLRPSQRLALQLRDAEGQLQITWNETARPVRNAQSAAIEITDGNANTWLELDLDQLRRGNVTYVRRSNMVAVRLKIQPRGGAPVEEVARFLGPPEPLKPSVASAGHARSRDPQRSRRRRCRQHLPRSLPRRFQRKAPRSQQVICQRDAAPRRFQPEGIARGQRAGAALAPQPEVVQTRQQQPASAPASVPASDLPKIDSAAPLVEKPAAQPAISLPVKPAVVRPPAATVGRLIWTGHLAKNGTVTIEGKKASAGALTGELPGKSVRIAVYPGDLAADGIVIFTPHTQYAKPVAENPSAQTGWNKATYTWNTQRSGEVIVDEAPGAQNGWNRIVLRSKTGRFSVIVVDWTLLPQ